MKLKYFLWGLGAWIAIRALKMRDAGVGFDRMLPAGLLKLDEDAAWLATNYALRLRADNQRNGVK